MNTSAKMIIVLTIIATLSGGILSMWNGVTEPLIEENRQKVLEAAIGKVLPGIDKNEPLALSDEITLYVGRKTGQENPVGYAFKAKGNGFSPDLTIMVGVNPSFSEVIGIEILEQTETPGLGNKIEDDWFKDQFKGLLLESKRDILVVKNKKPDDPRRGIQAISGATISSKAVKDIMLAQTEIVRPLYQK